MSENTVRLRVVFDDHHMLSKSKKKEGLKRVWLLLKPQHTTISDLSSHLLNSFHLHRTCPNGITLSMEGFVLPPFESTCILKDKDIICVKRKGSVLVDDEPAMLPSAPHENLSIELPKLLAVEGFQEEEEEEEGCDDEGCETVPEEDYSDQLEDAVYVEARSDQNSKSKKRKASKKLKSPSKKKMKLASADKLAVTSEVDDDEENRSSQDRICHKSSLSKKNKKLSNLSSQQNKSGSLDSHKQSNDKSDEQRSLQPQGGDSTKKPSRSARRKKAKRKWLREQQKLQKEKQNPSTSLKNDGQQLPLKNNNCIVSNLQQQSDEESEAEDDIVPVEIRPGHIRFEPLRKDQEATQNQFPVATHQWNGITSKKKGQKWGKEWTPSHKKDVYEHSSEESPVVQNTEKKRAFNSVDFDKLTPYTSLPKEGDIIAYRLIELSSSWTPELSSFRVGKILQYDAKSSRISLEPVLEYPFDFKKIIDEQASPVQFDPSPYEEDGSLEIEYSSLADVRVINPGKSDSTTVVACSTNTLVNPPKATSDSINGKFAGHKTAAGSSEPESGGTIPAKENGQVNVWDEINEALAAKKAKLSQTNGWRKEESSGTQSWSQRALRCSALGPTMAFLRSQKGL